VAFNKEKVMDAARKFVDRGQIDKAVKEYLRIVSEDPKDVRVWLKIGDLYAKKGAKQEATDTYLKVARFYHEQGFLDKAIAVYQQILKLDPRLVDVILKLAELYRQRGKLAEAMQYYESVAAHFHREGNTKDALGTVAQLVDLDPENIATRIKLAELYSKEGLLEEAATQFTHACDQLRRQGRQDDFVKVAERLLWHKPDNHALNRELAGLYLRRNDPRRALQKLQACFKADPRDVETLGLLALAFQALEQKAKTVSVLKELARIHIENKTRDKAAEVYRKILEIVPNDQDAIAFVGPQAAPSRPAVPPRATTPLPAAVRAATHEAKFNITSDLPAMPPSTRMTGSMPLVDEQSLSGVDFALPEYDDSDFSADMEPPPDPRRASAAGERHAEEISKILAETDVYVKYGLHQKAVDHLRRVFTLDGENVEAHERLKDIFISQGREQEAELELLKLAELVAPGDPDRAEQYLQELLAMNGTHTGAFELARRFRLRVARMSSVSAEVEYQGGGVAEVDGDLDDLELSTPPPSSLPIGRSRSPRDSIDDFDPNDIIGHVAQGSPAPSRPPQRPRGGYPDEGGYDLDFDSQQSQSTRQVPPEQIEALAAMPDEYEDGALLVGRPPQSQWNEVSEVGDAGFDGVQRYRSHAEDALEAQLDDDALGQDIDQGVAAELGNPPDDLPFDPDAARAFDAGMSKGGETDAIYVSGFEQTDLPQLPDTAAYGDVAEPDGLAVAGSYDPYGAGQQPAGYETSPAPYSPPEPHYDATVMTADLVDPKHGRAASLVDEDLDEADFYAGQGMYPEAMDALRALHDRYPNHPLILAKMREVQMLEAGGGEMPMPTAPSDSVPIEVAAELHTGGTEALDLDEIEEVSDDDFEEVSDVDGEAAAPVKRKPTVMLEKPVDEGDADTHYDLGLAYKEMGLYDEAIKAFDKVIRAPGREVQCRVMLGMCQREQGNPQEAIHQFKQGLHANPTDRERLSLYYEIGMTYESIGDGSEALYYFEAVTKRDPNFADAGPRAEQLRSSVGSATPPEDDL
jgi:tetratricopeptide (TPR) repeat protein